MLETYPAFHGMALSFLHHNQNFEMLILLIKGGAVKGGSVTISFKSSLQHFNVIVLECLQCVSRAILNIYIYYSTELRRQVRTIDNDWIVNRATRVQFPNCAGHSL
jgi:hypothetical protein